MRPNNRQRSRGGRNGGSGHHKQHSHNPHRPPNRNQIFDSSGPDVRVRGNAHQVFDRYQALAREAASSGDRISAEAYWQYADHYFRMIQTQGGFVQRDNQGWGDGEEGQPNPQHQGPSDQLQQANGNGQAYSEQQGGGRDDRGGRAEQSGREVQGDSEPGLGGVRFLQNRRSAPSDDPAADEQPEVPEVTPPTGGRRRR
jgi:hypothetical protein